MNTEPTKLDGGCFSFMENQLSDIWKKCLEAGKKIDASPLLIGTLPTLEDNMLTTQYMTESTRYKALNEQIFHLRKNQKLDIQIDGVENLHLIKSDIMLEAASTSVQVHLQVSPQEAPRYYNASLLASAPSIAVSANSPYLYGRHLWDETRIPVFENTVQIPSYVNNLSDNTHRVTFGTGYMQDSAFETFSENLDIFPPLIPVLFEDDSSLPHLKFHNGTIWRWNRPILGHSDQGPHLRIEHRVMASGPSLKDIIANMIFYIGLTQHFVDLEDALENEIPFTVCKDNFYNCAKYGLDSKMNWKGRSVKTTELIKDYLIPESSKALVNKGIDKHEVSYYLEEIILQRVLKNQNGANWQKAFVGKHGRDFQALTSEYLENQTKGEPVYKWKI